METREIAIISNNPKTMNCLADVKISVLGIPYFDLDGKLQHDTGIYARPDNLESFNPKLYWNTIQSIDIQNAKYSFRLENGRSPTKQELKEFVNYVKSKTTNKSHSILSYVDSEDKRGYLS